MPIPVHRIIPSLAFLIGLQALPTWAQFTWQTTHTSNGGFNSGIASIAYDELYVTVHPGYLDVEEEVELAALGAVSDSNDAATLELNGTFSLPPDATVVGVILWNGNAVLEGKLLSKAVADSLYQDQVDRNSTPPVRPRDPILLSLASPGEYRFSIYPVALNESRRFRVRYHLAPKLGPQGIGIPLGTAFAKTLGNQKVQIHLTGAGKGDSKVDSVQWVAEGSPRLVSLPRNLFVTASSLLPTPAMDTWAYGENGYWGPLHTDGHPGIEVRPKDPQYQIAYATELPEGQMQGHYLHLYSQVPDEALEAAGMRMEIVVLWIWNNVATWDGNSPTIQKLNAYDWTSAYQAADQTQMIQNVYRMIQPNGSAIGLVHSDGVNPTKVFPLAKPNEAEFTKAMEYLGQWNYSSIAGLAAKASAQFKPGKFNAESAKVQAISTFETHIRLVRSVYSKKAGVVRHLILATAGIPAGLETIDELNEIMRDSLSELNVTSGLLMNQAFAFPGLDFSQLRTDFPAPKNTSTQYLTPYPAELPTLPNFITVATLRNENASYDLDLKCLGGLGLTCENLAWHGKSLTPWDAEIEWQVFNGDGRPMGSTKVKPLIMTSAEDTALAVLWAGSESPFSEKREPPFGPVYGFVDATASLLALEKDTLSTASPDNLPAGSVPRIANADILAVIPNYNGNTPPGNGGIGVSARDLLQSPQTWKLQMGAGGELELRIPGLAGHQDLIHLRLLNLKGRELGEWKIRPMTDGILRVTLPHLEPGLHWLNIQLDGVSLNKPLFVR